MNRPIVSIVPKPIGWHGYIVDIIYRFGHVHAELPTFIEAYRMFRFITNADPTNSLELTELTKAYWE